ncbi:hypothetical protein RhiirA5_417359 [Rhizophagus irregularis]|uniref:Uncharacterized protein n=2 Tax=Rhizophagus irregularis TaxID=588596 RepID=A0A2I1DX18_9GLOM|nr:hypothetical protein GLOIN_2v1765494 [Rhizophagus irregularis DAOM 181602=DAOM 197198]PKC08084.1 hypothetical protein RhiirA5_417359 [Rhizophagus irregularis]PKC64664.1 hypothetical protein RhiirA1_462110 [Rhizophagus irregularis]PKY14423.1 hypothetical protein RhiirB3_426412 [Rhizophagus irregularis]POG79538.1 hypothetical protein GLOIN_2v1765494 [Rhizophagus irregularis DAOM 181602=DAOM 197198]GET57344.1 hypothetical protein GLOIN_2v1765494 [Rhizophagus irregularis DAOM 181602=DAOM 197198|eukprot:XP_025186404.1 hypothetical protein GLOIN_2v1765494 [Rhizophagus irregularis DAOM 181602=DAOM 197198]
MFRHIVGRNLSPIKRYSTNVTREANKDDKMKNIVTYAGVGAFAFLFLGNVSYFNYCFDQTSRCLFHPNKNSGSSTSTATTTSVVVMGIVLFFKDHNSGRKSTIINNHNNNNNYPPSTSYPPPAYSNAQALSYYLQLM